jgi:hypothetical protein
MWRTVVGDVRYRGLHEVQLDVYDMALQTGRRHRRSHVGRSAERRIGAPIDCA